MRQVAQVLLIIVDMYVCTEGNITVKDDENERVKVREVKHQRGT